MLRSLLLSLLALTLAACADQGGSSVAEGMPESDAPVAADQADVELRGQWVLAGGIALGAPALSQAGDVLVESPPIDRPTLSVTPTGVSGNAGCNSFNASFSESGDEWLGPIRSTRRACPDNVMDVERAFLAALGEVTTQTITDGQLTLSTDGEPLMFDPA